MAPNTARDFRQIQKDAVCRFLQTALVIDDHVTTGEASTEEESGTPGERLIIPNAGPSEEALPPIVVAEEVAEADSAAGDETANESDESSDDTRSQVNVARLADSFADQGLTCGVLRPEGDAHSVERIVSAASRVDIVVIDWRIGDETGDIATDAIQEMVEQNGHGSRLIAVYTTQRDLAPIEATLRNRLDIGEPEEGQDPLEFDVGGTHIVILNKGGVAVLEENKKHQVIEADLPQELIRRFESHIRGLVPSAALNALAATRENTHRLLSRMSSDLDVGYVGQLLRIAHVEDGPIHLVNVLADEMQLLIEDDDETLASAGLEGVNAWLGEREELLQASLDDVQLLLESEDENGSVRKKLKKEKNFPKEAELSSVLDKPERRAISLESDALFSRISATWQPYGDYTPNLQLGTIVREAGKDGHLLICVQPLCDSVRLDAPTRFPMLRVEVASVDEQNERFHFVVESDHGQELLRLWVSSKPRDIHVVEVAPNESRVVQFKRTGADSPLTVTDTGGKTLELVGVLKPAYAQRLAEQLSAKISRIGLDESEWQRQRFVDGKVPGNSRRPSSDDDKEPGDKTSPSPAAKKPAPKRPRAKKSAGRSTRDKK